MVSPQCQVQITFPVTLPQAPQVGGANSNNWEGWVVKVPCRHAKTRGRA